jgi:hypothetical protein
MPRVVGRSSGVGKTIDHVANSVYGAVVPLKWKLLHER